MGGMYNKYAHSRVVLQVLWCMHCLRVSSERPTDPAVAFYINCQCSANGSSKCALCEGNRPCERPAEGMRGDAYDLSSILKWASLFWDDPAKQQLGYPEWPSDFKRAVNDASRRLAKAFEATEKVHRISHKLIRDNKDPEARFTEYNAYIKERYELYPNPMKRPLTRATKEEWDVFNCERGQRLRDGDPGHMAWAVAKQLFYEFVQGALLEVPLPNEGARLKLQEDIAKAFPVTLHSI